MTLKKRFRVYLDKHISIDRIDEYSQSFGTSNLMYITEGLYNMYMTLEGRRYHNGDLSAKLYISWARYTFRETIAGQMPNKHREKILVFSGLLLR